MTQRRLEVETPPLRWRGTAARAAGVLGALILAAAGLLFSRPDAVALAMPLALWSVLVARPPKGEGALRLELSAEPGQDEGEVRGRIEAVSAAEIVQLSVLQPGRRRRTADVAGRAGEVRTRSRLLHSGPNPLLAATARLLAADGAWVSGSSAAGELIWYAAPPARDLPVLPLAPRLRGLHGAHEGDRAGLGGDFRDLHPFAPGDELRRVDWRATARLARRADELFIRRTNAQSDASIVIMLDTADELGEAVATWGADEPERSGPTSLDMAREAARSLAEAAIGLGDRVALHELHPAGRSLRSAAGRRQLHRILSTLAAIGPRDVDPELRRTPPVPTGSVIYVLSTFFVGSAARLALSWRTAGHRVIAVDTLPAPDETGIEPQRRTAMRILLAERREIFRELRQAGVEVLAYGADPDAAAAALHAIARVRR